MALMAALLLALPVSAALAAGNSAPQAPFAQDHRAVNGAPKATRPYSLAYSVDSAAPEILGVTPVNGEGGVAITMLFSEPVKAVEGKTVSLTVGETTYVATLGASDDSLSRQYTIALQAMLDGNQTAPTLDGTAAYAVAVSQGAFVDGSGNACAERNDLTLTANAEGNFSVVHDLQASMGWKLTAVGADGAQSDLASGGTVAANTTVKAVASDGDNPCSFAVYSGGARVSGADLRSGYAIVADTQIYIEPAALSGTASITGETEYGKTLTAVYAPPDGVTGPTQLTYAWTREGAALTADGAAYTLTKDDIGKKVTVTIASPWCTGTVSGESAVITKATVPAPAAPTVQTQTNTGVTLGGHEGYAYRVGEANWQDSPEFTGLVVGQTYSFYQYSKETDVNHASPASAACTVTMTQQGLTGSVQIEGAAQVGVTLKALVRDSNATGALTYRWMDGTTELATGETYTVQSRDFQRQLTVEVTCAGFAGSIHATTAAVGKNTVGTPAAPTIASKTASSVTLNAVAGCEYSIDGVNWRDSTTFDNLVPGQNYTFYQRYKETATAQASAPSAGTGAATAGNLGGAIQVTGDVRYGKTLVASYNGSSVSGALTYIWYRGATQVGTGATYDVSAADIGNPIYVRVISNVETGSVTQLVGTAKKAEYVGNAPGAPTRASRSTSKISLTDISGYEYSIDGANWQDSAVFTGLKAGTSYRFYQRVKASSTVDASPASAALKTSTSSSGSDSSSTNNSASNNSNNTDDDGSANTTTATTTTLTNYALTGDNTRILFSTMEGLINGNKTQDVTIRASNAEFTFAKSTMQLTAGTLWYDFGVTVNGGTQMKQEIEKLAGEHYVALVHFNYEGNLPAKANIRIALGAEHAGKTLYYYKYLPASNTLNYMQSAVSDATGWVSVEQSSCSDYVFLDADLSAIPAQTPPPVETPLPAATPTALVAEAGTASGSGFGGGWLIAVMVSLPGVCVIA